EFLAAMAQPSPGSKTRQEIFCRFWKPLNGPSRSSEDYRACVLPFDRLRTRSERSQTGGFFENAKEAACPTSPKSRDVGHPATPAPNHPPVNQRSVRADACVERPELAILSVSKISAGAARFSSFSRFQASR